MYVRKNFNVLHFAIIHCMNYVSHFNERSYLTDVFLSLNAYLDIVLEGLLKDPAFSSSCPFHHRPPFDTVL